VQRAYEVKENRHWPHYNVHTGCCMVGVPAPGRGKHDGRQSTIQSTKWRENSGTLLPAAREWVACYNHPIPRVWRGKGWRGEKGGIAVVMGSFPMCVLILGYDVKKKKNTTSASDRPLLFSKYAAHSAKKALFHCSFSGRGRHLPFRSKQPTNQKANYRRSPAQAQRRRPLLG
jgi:hypothetical protein